VIAVLAAAVLLLGIAWWQGTREAASTAPTASSTRTVELPVPTLETETRVASPAGRDPVPLAAAEQPAESSLSAAAHTALEAAAAPANATVDAAERPSAASEPTLPSAAALAAEGVLLPTLRLDLHAYSERRAERFIFINGRKYTEGERLPEGVVLETIEPRGAVLSHNGRRFLLFAE
jgi:general secretion pathway protein B